MQCVQLAVVTSAGEQNNQTPHVHIVLCLKTRAFFCCPRVQVSFYYIPHGIKASYFNKLFFNKRASQAFMNWVDIKE